MIGALGSWPIAVRIAISGLIGVTASMLLLLADGIADSSMSIGSTAGAVLRLVAMTIALLPVGLVFVSPLLIMAIVAGVLLERRIEQRLLSWSLAAPVIVWGFVCVMSALLGQDRDFPMHGFRDRLVVTMRDPGNLAILFGAFVAGLAFYVLSAMRRAPTAKAAGKTPRP